MHSLPHSHSPDQLLQAALSFRSAKALLCAVELGLFSELARGPRTGRQLRRALGLSERAAPDLLDALVAMGVLDREGDDAQAVYLNTRDAGRYLDRCSPDYLGGLLEAASARGYGRWSELGAAVKARSAAPAPAQSAAPASSPFAHAFDALADALALGPRGVLAYVDAGGEQLGATLARRYPRWQITRIDARDALPAAEVIVLVGVVGACRPEARLALIRHVHKALPAGGRLVAVEALIDDARRRNLFALLASLDAMLGPEGGTGFGLSGADFQGWCVAAGFADTRVIALGATCSAAVARR
ncbi:MAG: methyltransferase dimerization domain-containing protein [Burkholderiales bacterium]